VAISLLTAATHWLASYRYNSSGKKLLKRITRWEEQNLQARADSEEETF
jgi:hypothetical protein